MNSITLLQPPRVVFGNGCAPQCAEFLAQRGLKRVLLVSSTPVLPTLETVLRALKEKCSICPGTPGGPRANARIV
jgi:alcohol dehydrogenase class IV